MPSLPTTPRGLYGWEIALFAGYLVAAVVCRGVCNVLPDAHARRRITPTDWLFNGLTFSYSVVLLVGILNEVVLRLIGDTTAFLILGAMAGLGYSVLNLWPAKLS